MSNVKLGDRSIPVPRSRWLRLVLGTVLVLGGLVGFLPILGFWMIPLGLLVLSIDIAIVRRWRRKGVVRHTPWIRERFPRSADLFGLGNGNGNGASRGGGGAAGEGDGDNRRVPPAGPVDG
jgi:hypothetical protein